MSRDMTQPTTKRLVLVAGVGRSGTSLFTTPVSRRVPRPAARVVADPTNPKGFGEPPWVVDFHGRQLRSRRVSVWDCRPGRLGGDLSRGRRPEGRWPRCSAG